MTGPGPRQATPAQDSPLPEPLSTGDTCDLAVLFASDDEAEASVSMSPEPMREIDLRCYDQEKFEKLIWDLLVNNQLNNVQFSRPFILREYHALINRYIADKYYHVDTHVVQIEEMAQRIGISLDQPFIYRHNANKHNLELEGFTAENVLAPESVAVIEDFKINWSKNLLTAVQQNDLSTITRYYYAGADVNVSQYDRLPLELACELNLKEIVKYLIDIYEADPNLPNRNGVNALMQCCLSNHLELLIILMESNKHIPVEFLDVNNPDYRADLDILRIILDLQRPELLDKLLSMKDAIASDACIDSDDCLNMYNYAEVNNYHAIMPYLYSKWQYYLFGERQLMGAIINGDLETIDASINNSVNINKTIDGKYPLELACELGQVVILNKFLKEKSVEWFDYNDTEDPEYNPKLDPGKLAIAYDQPEILKAYLIHVEGDPDYIHYGIPRLENILAVAISDNKPKLISFINDTFSQRQEQIEKLFNAAVSGDVAIIKNALKTRVKINSKLNGKTILHILSELNHTNAARFVLGIESIDINIPDHNGDYPITIACKQGNVILTKLLLANETIRVSGFNDQELDTYDPNLDLLRLAIDVDDIQMLEELLKDSQQSQKLITIDYENISALQNYAFIKEKSRCLLKLNQYVTTISHSEVLFVIKHKSEVKELVDNAQGIMRVEPSFITSIKKLCRRYNIPVVATADGKHKTLEFKQDKYALLHSLERMIEQAKGYNYTIYTQENSSRSARVAQVLSDEEFRNIARSTYQRLCSSFDPSVLNKWYSAWCEDGSERVDTSTGILSAEVWCLAILAAQDKHAIAGKILNDLDVFDREQILVRTLVECARAYFYNENYIDTGADPRPSCEHGVAVRALLALCGLHKDIVIIENPLDWAGYVAKDELTNIYMKSPQKAELSHLLGIQQFQLNTEQLSIVEDFYNKAKTQVEIRLIEELGLMNNGGYLRIDELKKILDSLRDISLPLIEDQTSAIESQIYTVPDFTLVDGLPILNQNQDQLQQFKLPNTADSAYAAILISALDNNLSLPSCCSVQQLRDQVATVLDTALNNPQDFNSLFKTSLAKCSNTGMSSAMICRIIKHRFIQANSGNEDADKHAYIYAVRHYAAPDMLVLTVISAIYGANICFYDFKGSYIIEFNSSLISLNPKVKTSTYLQVCCRTVTDGNRLKQDFSTANALVKYGNWDYLLPAITELGISSVKECLESDSNYCQNYSVMYGRNIAGYEQIKIPGDGNCCFNAVFIAARHAEVANAKHIESAADLRLFVQHEISLLDPELLQPIITEYNSHYSRNIATVDEYVAAIGTPGVWGGELELRVMAKLLGITINIYSSGHQNINTIGENPGAPQINLFHTINHYNILMPPGTWRGIDYLGINERPIKYSKLAELLI